jgi:hypothetical protein
MSSYRIPAKKSDSVCVTAQTNVTYPPETVSGH